MPFSESIAEPVVASHAKIHLKFLDVVVALGVPPALLSRFSERREHPLNRLPYRCSAEPVENYLAKGGKIEDTVGRKCLCNALMANIGHAQSRKDQTVEPPLITVGDDLNSIAQYVAPGQDSYSAADVVAALLNGIQSEKPLEQPVEHALIATA